MPIQKFRKLPIVVEAIQWTGVNEREVFTFMFSGLPLKVNSVTQKCGDEKQRQSLYIETIEGIMRADRGWWIIKGVEGEFYPCKPEIFAKTYERVME
jgi:hypothetical protein